MSRPIHAIEYFNPNDCIESSYGADGRQKKIVDKHHLNGHMRFAAGASLRVRPSGVADSVMRLMYLIDGFPCQLLLTVSPGQRDKLASIKSAVAVRFPHLFFDWQTKLRNIAPTGINDDEKAKDQRIQSAHLMRELLAELNRTIRAYRDAECSVAVTIAYPEGDQCRVAAASVGDVLISRCTPPNARGEPFTYAAMTPFKCWRTPDDVSNNKTSRFYLPSQEQDFNTLSVATFASTYDDIVPSGNTVVIFSGPMIAKVVEKPDIDMLGYRVTGDFSEQRYDNRVVKKEDERQTWMRYKLEGALPLSSAGSPSDIFDDGAARLVGVGDSAIMWSLVPNQKQRGALITYAEQQSAEKHVTQVGSATTHSHSPAASSAAAAAASTGAESGSVAPMSAESITAAHVHERCPQIEVKKYANKAEVEADLNLLKDWLDRLASANNDDYRDVKQQARNLLTENNLGNLSQNELVELFEAINASHESSEYRFLSVNTQFPHRGVFSLSYSNATGTRHHCGMQIQLALAHRLIEDSKNAAVLSNAENLFFSSKGRERIYAALTAKIQRVGFDQYSTNRFWAPSFWKRMMNTEAFNRVDQHANNLLDGRNSKTTLRGCLYPTENGPHFQAK